jgi:ParB family transcriptional regulator, chromosome partitioning protein
MTITTEPPISKQKAPLGRGLSALLSGDDDYTDLTNPKIAQILPVSVLVPGKYQPRQEFDEDALNQLAESIAKNGVLQPILVRKIEGAASSPIRYEIIAGERRWRASQMAGLKEIPTIVKNLSDRESLEIAIIENVQRQDLSPLEEAEGYYRLMDEFGYTQEQLSARLHISRSHLANTLRLLRLPDSIKQYLKDNVLTVGHARALMNAENPERLADVVVSTQANVRQTEALVAQEKNKVKAKRMSPSLSAAFDRELAQNLQEQLTLKLKLPVTVGRRGGGWHITFSFSTLMEAQRFMPSI